ncbi:hypothetical protein HYH03_012510 [Edaphochlamys debaryana]|uniref:t-SNARE coiled-coil homology domain-containing protein n=1 Tax=Edaphochlamys debaryana TaxID=47281 RepID=A0A835XSR8_9CHLO|nr:hypothetical protein HYH03_012510 [Edaphochlamys debaryana]|eukprot:KAG2489074.1 hypothetical protein HYH03_012510 [Edaphochlamys debaryana]
MDRTPDLTAAAERFLATASLPPEQARKLREAIILRRSTQPGSFAVAARSVEEGIGSLRDSIRSMQTEYAREAGALSQPDPAKDANEAQVAGVVTRLGGYIDRLKQAATSAQATGGSANEQTAAHMFGVVLILAERLGRATTAFDRLRAARYQALVDRRRPGVGASADSTKPGSDGAASSSGDQQPGPGSGSGSAAASAGSISAARSLAVAAARSGWAQMLGRQAVKAEARGGGRGTANGGGLEGSHGAAGAAAAAAAAQVTEQESKALLDRLNASRSAALSVETAVRDVAALNQMFSAAVLSQASTIEEIYMAAVDATHNLTAGNESLRKTVDVNRSTSRYIVVLLLVATLGLLFFDWFNS